jgi:hypothetical protein
MDTRFQTREEWLQAAVDELRPEFAAHSLALPSLIRTACGFTSAGRRGRVIGECWSPKASADAATEILISPTLDDGREVLAVLVHELIHASGIQGHVKAFGRAAQAMDLTGPNKATVPGPGFDARYAPILSFLGGYPHAKLMLSQDKPKQGTRMLKACCPSCGYTIRLTQKWASLGLPTCICGDQIALEGDAE